MTLSLISVMGVLAIDGNAKKKRTVVNCLALLLMTVMTSQAQGRTDVLLNDGWTFRPISDTTYGKQGTAVTLPHTWNASYVKGTYYNRETMVYNRMLNVSEKMLRSNRLFVRFEGVNSVADVFVNRKTVGHHKGGYTAFCIEITDFVHEGNNELEVWAGNAFRTDVLPIAGDFNVYGGILTGRRFKNRKYGLTDVKAYTNQKEATLYINGRKIGKTKADDIGRLQWHDVTLSEGENRIEVRSGKLCDTCTWIVNTN